MNVEGVRIVTVTAEVRTLMIDDQIVRALMIGDRQATMSLIQQSDWVVPEDIEPFGRVNAGDHPGAEVVGRSRRTGELVKSSEVWDTDVYHEWEALPVLEFPEDADEL